MLCIYPGTLSADRYTNSGIPSRRNERLRPSRRGIDIGRRPGHDHGEPYTTKSAQHHIEPGQDEIRVTNCVMFHGRVSASAKVADKRASALGYDWRHAHW